MAKNRNNKEIDEKKVDDVIQPEEVVAETDSVATLLGVDSVEDKSNDEQGTEDSTESSDTDNVITEDKPESDSKKTDDVPEDKPENAVIDVDSIDAKVNAIIASSDIILSKIRKVSDLIPSDKGGKLMKSLVYLFSNRINPSTSSESVISEQKSFARLFKQFAKLQQTEFDTYFKYFVWAYKSLLDPKILEDSGIGLIKKLSPLDSLNIIQYCGNSKDSTQASFIYIVTALSLKIENPKQKIDNKKMSVENAITTQELDKINNFFNK